MRRAIPLPSRRRGFIVCCLVLAAAAGFSFALLGHDVPRASGLLGAPELVARTDDSAPLSDITLFGASPGEEAGEVWGLAPAAGSARPVRYSPSAGWQLGPQLQDSSGEPLGKFSLDTPEAFREKTPSPLAAQMAPDGAGAMLGSVGGGESSKQVVLVRDPGAAFKEAPLPEGEAGLHTGETLFALNRPPLLAALEEPGGKAGVLVAPSAAGAQEAVLHWDGSAWARETIEVASAATHFEVLAIGASSPENAWLLGRSGGAEGTLSLFRRHAGGASPVWRPVATRAGGEPGAAIEIAGEPLDEPGRDQAQLLTVTSSGVWLDARMHAARAPTTLYFAPEGEADAGTFTGVWCQIPASSPGATAQASEECAKPEHSLPELPTDYERSFAWPGAGFGDRIVTGGFDGRMVRLHGTRFEIVDSLGSQPGIDPGATFGAAFASPADGWLGNGSLPVHITDATAAAPNRLTSWPVPFRFALVALAPQPDVSVGAPGSEAVAVGDRGEVARFHPGQGWFPETLLGPGGQRETPRLRAVAWPTPGRVYAVGDSERGAGQMWLWRGETGLWEKDPAMPLNFRGNLLGVAFDPANSARGYAVGQQGALLRYGKSWVQEEEQSLPAAVRGADFTSIAFAGSEAIVVWRKAIEQGRNSATGGVIVNDGSGWKEDEGAHAALAGGVPWAVAALPDGGAAFSAGGGAQSSAIFERNEAGQPWQGVSYPGGVAPGYLTLFRENGALRAIGTGAQPFGIPGAEEPVPPPGFPAVLVDPYPLIGSSQRGVLRQTATGWSDEEHELNEAREPPGDYRVWDTPAIPDPVSALLVDPTGGQGWAVGGIVNNANGLLDTADIWRYPDAEASSLETPLAEKTGAGSVAVAVGGGAACAAPCASRADTGVGPEVWLRRAIAQTEEIGAVKAFLYTGPGVTTGETGGPRLFPVPWSEEESFYAGRTSSPDPEKLPICVAPAPSDREGNGEGSPASFEAAFGGAVECHGSGSAKNSYAFEREGLRVIVLDTSLVQAGQRTLAPEVLGWLQSELAEAAGHAIVVGNADLPREYSEGHGAARQLVAAIEEGSAAAYFFDAPEQNVQETLTGVAGATPAFGSGTLGYVNVASEEQAGFIGQSGSLLAEVSSTVKTAQNRYAVTVRLVPDVEQLAVEGEQGTLLRRSQVASFAGLARRPHAGNRSSNQLYEYQVAPYVAIPDICRGAGCARGIVPEYRFSSSDPHYGQFVKRNLNSAKPNAVLYDAHGKPVPEEAEGGKDGLFCAYNATPPGKPIEVTLETGNLRYSLPVTIQGGSVRQPCGTTALATKPATAEPSVTPPPIQEAPPTNSTAPTGFKVSVPAAPPAPAAPATPHPTPPPKPLVNPFLPQPAVVAFLPPFVPVPLPTPARPTPPSGTSPVTSPVEAAQKEEEEEAAPESVDAAASAYAPEEHELVPAFLLGLLVLAAFAGASSRGRRGRRRTVKVAPATVNTSRAQRRWERDWRG